MPDILEQKLAIGRDIYDRLVTATRYRTPDGKVGWRLETLPSSVRDEGERMWAISDDNLRQLAACLATLGLK